MVPSVPTANPTISLQLPWAPILTPEEVQQGTTFYGGGARLRRMAAKLRAGRPVKVVTSTTGKGAAADKAVGGKRKDAPGGAKAQPKTGKLGGMGKKK